MRNPDRIPVVMDLITRIWKGMPDLRFHQFMDYIHCDFARDRGSIGQTLYKKNTFGNYKSYMPETHYDLFNVEDEPFLEYLLRKVEEVERHKD